jgi:primosomal protein N''
MGFALWLEGVNAASTLEGHENRRGLEKIVIETKSIHKIAEHKLNKQRLLSQRERDEADVRAGELLENAEFNLWQAVEKYMQRGGSCDVARRTVDNAIAEYRRNNSDALTRT